MDGDERGHGIGLAILLAFAAIGGALFALAVEHALW
jgi:hypothetical protein